MDDERQPLLANEPPAKPTLSIPHITSALAALEAGALPSSDQLSRILKSFLHSPLLSIDHTIFSPEYGTGRLGTGGLTREGERVRAALKEVVEALLRLVQEKNADDRMQHFLVACRETELNLSELFDVWATKARAHTSATELPSTPVPSPSPDALQRARQSLITVFMLFITSDQLRTLLADTVYLLRDAFDDAIRSKGEVGEVASAVVDGLAQRVAGKGSEKGKGKASEPELFNSEDSEPTGSGQEPADNETSASPEPTPPKTAEQVKDEFVDRFKQVRFDFPPVRRLGKHLLTPCSLRRSSSSSNLTPPINPQCIPSSSSSAPIPTLSSPPSLSTPLSTLPP
jgi:hypothetical protein